MEELVNRALAEDVGAGDVTTEALVRAGARARARIVQKAPGVVAGLGVAEAVFARVDPELRWSAHVREGEWRDEGLVAEVEGAAGSILRGERVALNFLARLSGVATLTARYVRAVDGTGATILDTRKTTPGLRALEKEAVKAGGGSNHRSGLFDAILVKENHIEAAGGVRAAAERALAAAADGMLVEIECATLDEVREALEAGAPRILLDNMGNEELTAAVALVAGRAELEASGGVTLETVRAIAETGVDYISVGALTHSAPALDLSLQLESE
jgi:nicotinate-nucleotide pyrophosphorylase (carboxylating)